MDAMFFVDFRPPNYLTSIASIEVEDFDPRKAFLTMEVKVLPVPMLPATGKVMPQLPIRLAPETRAKLQQEEAKWDASADHCTLWRLSKALPTPIGSHTLKKDSGVCLPPPLGHQKGRAGGRRALICLRGGTQ